MRETRIVFHPKAILTPDFCREPRMLYALRAFALDAPPTAGGVITITSVWRPDGTGYHPKSRAVDVRTGISLVDGVPKYVRRDGAVLADSVEQAHELCVDWARRVRARLGWTFDVVYSLHLVDPGTPNSGYEADHIDHIHTELDAKKDGTA